MKRWKFFAYTDTPYENFPRSLDMFGDGSVVLVPLPGHTAGPTGMFLSMPGGGRYFFIGDTSWVREGVALPAEKHFLAGKIADSNPKALRETMVRIHRLMRRHPDLVIVPAHDHAVLKTLAHFPKYEQ